MKWKLTALCRPLKENRTLNRQPLREHSFSNTPGESDSADFRNWLAIPSV